MPVSTSRCRSCGAEIIWAMVEKSGRTMPIDAVPVPDGNVEAVVKPWRGEGERLVVTDVYAADQLFIPTHETWVAHFATCPHAKAWSRK